MPVNSPNYSAYSAQWTRIRDAIAGEDAVKLKASQYLRRPDSMSPGDFAQYSRAATWFPATARAVAGLVGSIFRKDPKITAPDTAPLDDITGTGQPFVTFAKGLTTEVLSMGRSGVLTDVDGEGKPYLARYCAENIFNFRSAYIDGKPQVVLVVLREFREVPKLEDRFVTNSVERYRVLELARAEGVSGLIYTVSVFEKKANAQYGEEIQLVEGPIIPLRRGQPLDFIPFVFFSPNDLSPEIEQSPILGLVDMNISHFKTTAELENAGWFVGSPQLVISGRFQGGGEEVPEISVGSNTAIVMEEGGKAVLLQANEGSVGALKMMQADKEMRMAVLGARLLEPQQQGNPEHHDSVALRHRGEDSILANLSDTVSRGLTRCLTTLYWWAGTDKPKVTVALNKDFTPAAMAASEMLRMVEAWVQGGVGGKALFHQLQAGERLPAEWSYDDYLADIEINSHSAFELGFAFDNKIDKKEMN